jgi:hypothetical protein
MPDRLQSALVVYVRAVNHFRMAGTAGTVTWRPYPPDTLSRER